MNSRQLTCDDCVLLSNICLNSERITYLLEYRFKSNSIRTSFDFKSFLPEQLSNNTKDFRSSLKVHPTIIKSINNNDEENISSESSEDEIEETSLPIDLVDDDDYLDKLAEWEPDKSQTILENDENEEEEEVIENTHIIPMNLPIEISTTQVEDILITFAHYPVKSEPMMNDLNLLQLDGQTDFLSDINSQQKKRNKTSQRSDTSQVNKQSTVPNSSSSEREKPVWEHMIIAEQKLNSFRKIKTDNEYPPVQQKTCPVIIPKLSKSTDASKKKTKRLNQQLQTRKHSWSKSTKLPMEHNGKTLLNYFKVIKRSSTNENIPYSPVKRKNRSTTYFDGCIVVDDDDDIEEIKQQRYSISNNIHTREKLLDHAVHSSEMRIKWLLNVELILLEHISIFHQQNIQSSYHIDSSFISIIILNFLKIFIIRNCDYNQDELSFYQFGFTSYLRYLLIELPTYKHRTINDENDCFECKQYSLILNILFDLLFDLIEYDVCEIYHKENFRSSLIEEDYFNQLKINKKNQFYRMKLIIYFIELIGIHRNKCQKKKQEFFLVHEKKIFQWIEDFIRHIVYQINNLNNERISICLNVMELCLLFVTKKEKRIKQMVLFLAKLSQENPTYLQLFLFDENLLSDIRLLLINELIWNKFDIKFISMDSIDEFFHRIEISLKPPNSINDMTLLLIRSLFNTYADLMIDRKHSMLISSTLSERIISIFRHQLESIYLIVINLSQDSNYFQQIKRTVIFFRLLKCKWNRF